MFKTIRELCADESGATAIEYGLIAALVSVAGIVALQAMGGSLKDMFQAVSTQLDNAVESIPKGSAGSSSSPSG